MAEQNTLPELKQNLIEYCKLTMGDQIVDLELDPAHYEAAYQRTIGTYRQRANNAYEEAYIFMELIRDLNIYTLPQEVYSVRQIFRRTFGDSTGPFASNFDPFAQASINVYLMNFNVAGGLATYDFYSQYVELAGRMFGAYMNYTWNPVTKKLQLIRDPKGFAQIAGPQGGGQLNGTQMKTEGKEIMDAKIQELVMYVDASQPLTWVIG